MTLLVRALCLLILCGAASLVARELPHLHRRGMSRVHGHSADTASWQPRPLRDVPDYAPARPAPLLRAGERPLRLVLPEQRAAR